MHQDLTVPQLFIPSCFLTLPEMRWNVHCANLESTDKEKQKIKLPHQSPEGEEQACCRSVYQGWKGKKIHMSCL